MRIAPEEVERFWAKVRRGKPSECWEWTAGRDAVGYGRMKLGDTVHRAHRVMWLIRHGELPVKPEIVRHACDNPPCVNPAHLVVGSYHDNNQDCEDRGRMSRGARHPGAKLTDAKVLEMKQRHEDGWSYERLAGLFGVSVGTVSQIMQLRRWRHVEVPFRPMSERFKWPGT